MVKKITERQTNKKKRPKQKIFSFRKVLEIFLLVSHSLLWLHFFAAQFFLFFFFFLPLQDDKIVTLLLACAGCPHHPVRNRTNCGVGHKELHKLVSFSFHPLKSISFHFFF